MSIATPPGQRADVAWPQVGPLDTTAAGQARGVVLLAHACDAIGVKPCRIGFRTWGDHTHEVHADTRRDLDRLADHLGLSTEVGFYGSDNKTAHRDGVWRDMNVTVYGPTADPATAVA